MDSGIKIILLFLSYILIVFVVKILRSRNKNTLREWIPSNYSNEFKDAHVSKDILLDKGEEIPSDTPTLLIIGGLCTRNKNISSLDYLANLLTFGWLRFREIIPVGEPTDLKLYFQNISKKGLSI